MQLVRIGLERGGEPGDVGRDEVVGNQTGQQFEPEERDLSEDFALARNTGGEHVVECRNAVSGHQEQRSVHRIQIAHFAPAKQGRCAQIRCQESCHGKAFRRRGLNLRFCSVSRALSMCKLAMPVSNLDQQGH